ncbi:pilin [Luteibacter sp. NPDC031894]|uniref:pilin n=1 Tax=Luteibacter sp. NPDC031894 TaxID=3390572 RepID=UPI003D01B674
MKNIQKGFTLIELMIVVAIIAILAAIAIPQYQNYLIRTQVSEGMNLADGAKTAVSEFYNNKGHFPKTNESAGLPKNEASISGKYVSKVTVTDGVIGATFANTGGQEANDKIKDKVVALSPYDNGGSIAWNCRADASPTLKTNVDEQYLPTACRKK